MPVHLREPVYDLYDDAHAGHRSRQGERNHPQSENRAVEHQRARICRTLTIFELLLRAPKHRPGKRVGEEEVRDRDQQNPDVLIDGPLLVRVDVLIADHTRVIDQGEADDTGEDLDPSVELDDRVSLDQYAVADDEKDDACERD